MNRGGKSTEKKTKLKGKDKDVLKSTRKCAKSLLLLNILKYFKQLFNL